MPRQPITKPPNQPATGACAHLAYTAHVVMNERLNPTHMLMGFVPESAPPAPAPGQFFMVGLPGGETSEPLLKRPFCFLSAMGDTLHMVYRVKGKGTRALARLEPGDRVDVIGPLGNSWPAPRKGLHPVIVAGGIGVASVYPLIERLDGACTVVFGACTEDELLLKKGIEATGAKLHLATDDGTCGIGGTVIDVLNRLELEPGKTALYACGPTGMLMGLKLWAGERGLAEAYASLEEHMACGVGACMGCVVKTTTGYRRVCKDGPIFRLSDVEFAR